MAAISPAGTTSSPPRTTGGSGDIWRFQLKLLHALLQARLQRVRTLARFVGIQPGVRLSRLLLVLQLLRRGDPNS